MNFKLVITLLMTLFCFVTLNAQRTSFGHSIKRNSIGSKVKIEAGVNKSQLSTISFGTEEMSGGIGWYGNLLYSLQTNLICLETGLGYRSLNFMISDDLSQTQKVSTKATSISLPLLIGTNFVGGNSSLAPIIKGGVRLDYTLGLDTERTDILTESDLEDINYTFEFNIGFKFSSMELLFAYNGDINNYIKTTTEKNNYMGLKLAYYIIR